MTTSTRKSDGPLWVDIHTHCLPGMDDGAKDLETSLQMLRLLRRQGVAKAALTSHYYPHKESLDSFLKRREAAWQRLRPHTGTEEYPELLLGAEIYVTRGLSEQNLRPLCIGKTDLLLLELPRQPYKAWILEELRNLTYALDIIPVLAHLERYRSWYASKDFAELLSFDEFVLQCNAGALLDRKDRAFLYRRAAKGYPFVIGSDTHNMTTRLPDFQEPLSAIKKKRRGRFFLNSLQKQAEALHL